jgi:hypothetical protein
MLRKQTIAALVGLLALLCLAGVASAAAPDVPTLASAVMGPGASAQAVTLEADTLTIARGGLLAPYTSLAATEPFVVVADGPVGNSTVQFSVIGDTATAYSTLSALFPSVPISIVSATVADVPTLDDNRIVDPSPWTSGDYIEVLSGSGHACTDDFTYRGNSSGNLYNYTAQHCSDPGNPAGDAVQQNGRTMGHIHTTYLAAPNYADMMSFDCNLCGTNVWYNGSSYHIVHGDCTSACYAGGLVTFDGSREGGEQPDWSTIYSGPGCFYIPGERCGVEEAYKSGGNVNGGDSGSPVYQRTSNNDVWAAGLAIANSGSTDIWYETDAYIEQIANVTIYAG